MDFCLDYETYYVEKKNIIDLSKCMNYDEKKINKKMCIDFDKLDYTAPNLSNSILDERENSNILEFKNSQ